MPINAHPEYLYAEKNFHEANTDEERLEALEEMVKTLPSHKGAETLRRQIKTRYKKLKEKLSKEKIKAKARGKGQQGIRKAELQAVIIGFTNTGKSSILKAMTNAEPRIASYGFTTAIPEQGMVNYEGCNIQLIDMPPIGAPTFEKSILNSADTLVIVIEKIHELAEIKPILIKAKAKQIIVFNKIDLYDEKTRRKISDTLRSKRHNFSVKGGR